MQFLSCFDAFPVSSSSQIQYMRERNIRRKSWFKNLGTEIFVMDEQCHRSFEILLFSIFVTIFLKRATYLSDLSTFRDQKTARNGHVLYKNGG